MERKTPKRTLILLILFSSGIDLFIFFVGIPAWVKSLGGMLLIEEIMEYFISILIAKTKKDFKLDKWDKMAGLIPIPGITAVTIRAIRELV